MASMVALVHRKFLVEQGKQPEFQAELADFAETQMNYVLGDNPQNLSYMVGYGENWQLYAHHRSSHGSSRNDISDPELPRNILYGAIAGGPAADDSYSTDRADFPMTEVATDMNAGLTGALAGLVDIHGGKPLANFPAPVDKSIPEIKEILTYQIDEKRMFNVLRSNKKYQGEIFDDGFKVSRIISDRNSFLPTLNGSFKENADGTDIVVKFELSNSVIAFMIVFGLGILFTLLKVNGNLFEIIFLIAFFVYLKLCCELPVFMLNRPFWGQLHTIRSQVR
jgi:hypothetical protein